MLTADALAAGGQAGTSSRIENYLGFPAGISGAELTRNALLQAQRFGARITVPCEVRSLGIDGGDRVVTLADGTRLRTRCVLVASGVEYRKLEVPRFGDFEGAGIYYAATEMEARLCRGEEVVVVGGGNSAGQAIVFLARPCAPGARAGAGRRPGRQHVPLPGGPDRAAGQRHDPSRHRSSRGLEGDGHLGAGTGAPGRRAGLQFDTSVAVPLHRRRRPIPSWLRGCVELDRNGFVLTGTALPPGTPQAERWKAAGRAPFLLETSLPGVFAAGDVRSGSVKRVRVGGGRGGDGGELRACPPGASRGLRPRPARPATTSVGLLPHERVGHERQHVRVGRLRRELLRLAASPFALYASAVK